MKDKVFLIYSGDDATARKVKSVLEEGHHYACFFGNNDGSDSVHTLMGNTIVQQMNGCNQALVLFKGNASGKEGGNFFFELGYAWARYGVKKVHCVMPLGADIALPSDFDRAFVREIEAEDGDSYAAAVVDYFLSRQKLSIEANKMHLMNNRHVMRDMIQGYCSREGCLCSDYELAQYVLFYTEAAVMFQDEPRILDELRAFKTEHASFFSRELLISVNTSIALLEVQTSLINGTDGVYIEEAVGRRYLRSCRGALDDILDDDAGTFDEWARVFVSENITYVLNLMAANQNLSEESRRQIYAESHEYGLRCVSYIEDLESTAPCVENNDAIGLVAIFKGYIFRHLATASFALGLDDGGTWIKASLDARGSLLRNYDEYSIDTRIYDSFRLEYYLNLLEYLDMAQEGIGDFELRYVLDEIDDFLEGCEKKDAIGAYAERIMAQREKLECDNDDKGTGHLS